MDAAVTGSKKLITFVVMMAALMALIDITIVNVMKSSRVETELRSKLPWSASCVSNIAESGPTTSAGAPPDDAAWLRAHLLRQCRAHDLFASPRHFKVTPHHPAPSATVVVGR